MKRENKIKSTIHDLDTEADYAGITTSCDCWGDWMKFMKLCKVCASSEI